MRPFVVKPARRRQARVRRQNKMKTINERAQGRKKRKERLSHLIRGTHLRPRLSVFRSCKHLYAQVINDLEGKTIASISTRDKEIKGKIKATVDGAKILGERLAKEVLTKGVQEIVFDRNGFRYHGQLKALAEAAREAGLKF